MHALCEFIGKTVVSELVAVFEPLMLAAFSAVSDGTDGYLMNENGAELAKGLLPCEMHSLRDGH